jgi:hypothetical protein
VKLVNLDEATLIVKGPGGTRHDRVGAKLLLKAKGVYKITMVKQAHAHGHSMTKARRFAAGFFCWPTLHHRVAGCRQSGSRVTRWRTGKPARPCNWVECRSPGSDSQSLRPERVRHRVIRGARIRESTYATPLLPRMARSFSSEGGSS